MIKSWPSATARRPAECTWCGCTFDGDKGNVAADPDSEIVTATAVTPGNSGDAEAAGSLLPGDQDSAPGQAGGRGVAAAAGAGPPAAEVQGVRAAKDRDPAEPPHVPSARPEPPEREP